MIFIDQMANELNLATTPKRIISLVPSQTELLFDLSLRDEVIGITKFCIHPDEWFRTKTKVGGTKTIDLEKIKQLNPDLIIGNKEENEQEQIEELMKHYPVWMSDINTLKQAFDMITRVGMMVDKNFEAINLKLKIEAAFKNLASLIEPAQIQNVSYFIWRNPFMVAGNNTFINEMLQRSGFKNVFASNDLGRYPIISTEQLANANPHLIFLSSEPYPFQEKHFQEFQLICPDAQIVLVDGELFSWYGSRLLQAPEYFLKLVAKLK
ncbi:MAG: cobalamin-binding protein [Bacteroidetes bacterium RIFCSPLOWO2_12_FULL_35_15]|nr:MAG: cobalamin-binding protein [Bacteroidetes bacterium RIFCSPLOWO2_12_FULL_35_15]